MTARLIRLLAATAGCLVALASANVAMAEKMMNTQGGDAAAAAPETAAAQADPGNLTSFRGQAGATLLFTVTGVADGGIYGDGIYTDDSPLATAAVHAGVLGVGETKDLQVEILPGQNSYKAAFSFGVHSNSYAAWPGSYKFLDTPRSEADLVIPEPGNVTDYQGKIGKVFKFQITGASDQSVWGDGVYTADSDLDTAAVHAGVLKDGEDGVVMVKILPGQGKYAGKSRNGVASQGYGKFGGSFEFVDADGNVIKPQG